MNRHDYEDAYHACMDKIICLKIKHSLDNLKPTPNFLVSDGKEEKKIRKALIRVHNYYALPADHISEDGI